MVGLLVAQMADWKVDMSVELMVDMSVELMVASKAVLKAVDWAGKKVGMMVVL